MNTTWLGWRWSTHKLPRRETFLTTLVGRNASDNRDASNSATDAMSSFIGGAFSSPRCYSSARHANKRGLWASAVFRLASLSSAAPTPILQALNRKQISLLFRTKTAKTFLEHLPER